MNSNLSKAILAGVIGTAIMTIVMMIAPLMGMPKMSPPAMLSGMMGLPVWVGWLMHFMVGITFAMLYTYLLSPRLKVSNLYLKGAIFGLMAFVAAQVAMAMMGAVLPMPSMEGPMVLNILGSLMGHLIFGMAVSKSIGFTSSHDLSAKHS